LLGRIVDRQSVCLRRLAGGSRRGIIGFGRFLANGKVTASRLIEGWGAQTAEVCAGRHVLALQDTSEINFATSEGHRRGLGEIGKGSGRGLLLHAMIGVDASTGGLLGLVTGKIWTREGRVQISHDERGLTDKESERWLSTAQAAKGVLARATMVTAISDREADIYAKWSRVPDRKLHLLIRAMHDRSIQGGGKLSGAALIPAGMAVVEDLRERKGRPPRKAHLLVRYGQVVLRRPKRTLEKDLPQTVEVSLVEVSEVNPPEGAEPILWRLLTTHPVEDTAMAWQIVEWYRQRWIVEQFFRTLKQQGLKLEDSQIESAERLIKLTAIAARAAIVIMQLVQARDGKSHQRIDVAFSPAEIKTLHALLPQLEGKTALQKNPHLPNSLAWAAWIIAKLGGWDGYPNSRPPGPITFRHGLEYFQAVVAGRRLKDV
jgi:hypothetical protein